MISYEITFNKEKAEAGKSKFGGQPDWVTHAEWPISKITGKPMLFICQINLENIGLGHLVAKKAFLFI